MYNQTADLNLSNPLVIGCGASGRAAGLFLQHKKGLVTIAEQSYECIAQNQETFKRQGITLSHESEVPSLDPYSIVITSPGLPENHALVLEAKKLRIPVIGEMEIALRFLNARAIGITGTNGKTSVTSLTHHVLKTCGFRSHAVGNIGLPLTGALLDLRDSLTPQDLFIIEMSSFQLEGLHVPVLEQGAILNLTPNHLNRHGTMESYARAKCCIAHCLKPNNPLYVHPQVLKDYASFLTHVKLKPLEVYENPAIENRATAFALCQPFGITLERFNEAAATWQPPHHRMTFVREKEGVLYYNDSKASNLAATEKAVACMKEPVILLAGGVHKGASYRPWIEAFKGKVRHLFVFGAAALQIEAELGMFFPVTQTPSLQAAIKAASLIAVKGDVVLLSPGCSSFDMFKDYIHRGESFEQWVKEL